MSRGDSYRRKGSASKGARRERRDGGRERQWAPADQGERWVAVLEQARHDGLVVGPDVDLEVEDVRLPDGTRLTTEVAEQIAGEIRHQHGGQG